MDGQWTSDMGQNGSIAADVQQFYGEQMTMDSLSGSVMMTGSPCLSSGDLLGQTVGDTARLIITQESSQLNVSGVISSDGRTIQGTYQIKFGSCTGDRGTVLLAKN